MSLLAEENISDKMSVQNREIYVVQAPQMGRVVWIQNVATFEIIKQAQTTFKTSFHNFSSRWLWVLLPEGKIKYQTNDESTAVLLFFSQVHFR